MGILYNRFTPDPSTWKLINTFTDVDTNVFIDITGKTELLVVCNDIVSMLFCIRDLGTVGAHYSAAAKERTYNTNTGTGYRFTVRFYQRDPVYPAPCLDVHGTSYDSVSAQGSSLSSVNTKVYAR